MRRKPKCILDTEVEGTAKTIEAALHALETMAELHPGIEIEMKLRTKSFNNGDNQGDDRDDN